jgi:hypothetical protein
MIWKRIMRHVLVAGMIICGPWLIAGCLDNTDHPIDSEVDCSAAKLSELVDKGLASVDEVDVDKAYDTHLLSDPWTGERATCESTAPDLIWQEGPWIKTREPCVNHSCTFFDETNFGTGFGTLKDGMMTFETLRVESVSETSEGWDVIIVCGEDDGSESLFIPLRVYGDVDLKCIDEINVAMPGYVQIDYFWIFVEVVDGVVDVTAVGVNDLYIHVDPFDVEILDGLLSDYISWLASWMEGDIEEFFGPMAKERVEAAYDEFVAECP